MNLVKIHGSLGEQMFQYAFYLALRKHCDDTKLQGDISSLVETFNLKHCDKTRLLPQRSLISSLFPGKNKKVTDPANNCYDQALLDLHGATFNGKWQSLRYFENIEADLIEEFSFRNPIPSNIQISTKSIDGSESVAIHISKIKSKDSTCTPDYYNWAIANINTFVTNPRFIIFTDDEKWARQYLVGCNSPTIVPTTKISESMLLQAMSSTQHVIMSNSPLSWWGAYLNNNENKIVIAPKPWNRSIPDSDIIPLHWTSIPVT